jgi:hypothetical protein
MSGHESNPNAGRSLYLLAIAAEEARFLFSFGDEMSFIKENYFTRHEHKTLKTG